MKSPEMAERAKQLFADTGVQVTSDGESHIGAFVGSGEFKEQYVKGKFSKRTDDVMELSVIAKQEPQAALSAFNVGL